VDWVDPIFVANWGERIVGYNTDYKDSESMAACTQNRVDGGGIGKEFALDLTDREIRGCADDGREFRMREVERGRRCSRGHDGMFVGSDRLLEVGGRVIDYIDSLLIRR